VRAANLNNGSTTSLVGTGIAAYEAAESPLFAANED
jgi:hypothetical protein